jgi:RNA polymerase sigma-70 factor, ECF subfamily
MDQDRELVNRAIKGDYDAFELLVERHQGRIYRHLRKMVKDYNIAEDLLQETFLSAHKGLNRFSGNSSFATWLFRIATNTALMFLRKHRPDNVQYDDDLKTRGHVGHIAASPEFVNTPLDLLLSDEGRRKIEQAIDELPLMYRTVLMLRDVEGFSVREVSKITDSSVAAIKSRLHRARHSVREALNSYYSERETYTHRGVTAK